MADKSFADYVQDVMASLPTVDRSMLTGSVNPDVEKYRKDPLWKSREIKAAAAAAAADAVKEEEAKKKTLDEALQTPSNVGGSSNATGLDPAVAAFLDSETPQARDARLGAFQQAMPSIIGGLLGVPISGAPSFGQFAGLIDANGLPTAAGLVQAGQQYNNTPGWLQSLLPFSTQTIAASTPMGQTNPVQTAMLASQYESLGYSPQASAGLAIASQESSQGQQGTNASGGIGGSYADGGDYGD